MKELLKEIRLTRRKRTNIGTVYRAFKRVGGGNLKKIAQQITRPAKP